MSEAPPLVMEKVIAAIFEMLTQDPQYKVTEAEIRGNPYRVFENAPTDLAKTFALGAAYGEKEFLIFEDERISHAELWRRACRFAHALSEELGIKQGDHVALAMRNYPEWCVSYMAIITLGAVVVPLNAWWKTDELKFGLEDCGAKIVVADQRRFEYLAPLKQSLGLTFVLARGTGASTGGQPAPPADDAPPDYTYEALLAGAKNDAPPEVAIKPDDDFCIVYTSGSTGAPKGVVLTHRGCISALYSWMFTMDAVAKARDGFSLYGDDPGILLAVPLFHVTGSHSIFLLSYLLGRRMVMMYRWDAREAATVINREKLTNFVGVPSQSFELMEQKDVGALPSLVDIGSGGAKRPGEHVKKLKARFAGANPSSGYGLSETNALGCVISHETYQEHPDAAGRAVPPLTDIKIMRDGVEQPCGGVGEIWIHSPANFRGYHNLREETAKALTPDGWFKTGDLGRKDKEDFIYIVDRMKELIIRGGENISCLEVENRVYEYDGVAEAVVFSTPDELMGERVGLVVYPKADHALDVNQLHAFIAEDLAAYKVPERIWISPASLPRLGTAKFDKITIRKIALQNPPDLTLA